MIKPFYQDNQITIYNKDCRDMSELEDNSVQCVVTSPPYWGLRKYSGEQELDGWNCAYGLEPTPDCGRPFMKLRDDLTDKEREFVLSELHKFGAI